MRLTERKVAYPNCDKQGSITQVDYIEIKDKKLAEEKLCQLEDIEDELRIDLITLFKALKQGNIWVREHNTEEKEIVYEMIRLNVLNRTLDFVEPREEIGRGRFLIDYSYSWALTKEELKNE